MINAFFEGTTLKIYYNGNFAFCNDYYDYENRSVIVNGNTVRAMLIKDNGNKMCTVFVLNENGVVTDIHQENV